VVRMAAAVQSPSGGDDISTVDSQVRQLALSSGVSLALTHRHSRFWRTPDVSQALFRDPARPRCAGYQCRRVGRAALRGHHTATALWLCVDQQLRRRDLV